MDENEKYEPMSLEDYQLGESDYDDENGDVESETEEAETETEETETETETEEVEQQQEEEEVEQSEKQQTPEQNAKYAEQRRQSLVEQRVKQELEQLKEQSKEFQLAQMLANQYGMPIDQLYEQVQEAVMQKQAEEKGVPLEVMRQLTQYEQQQSQLQEQINLMQFQNWQNKIFAESQQMMTQYPMLTQDDIDTAKYYLLETLQNPEIPLQQAVYALHGDKIADSLKTLAKQEALAEISGRKKGGLPPQSMKSSDAVSLTDEERFVAKMMGISEVDYIKYKS
jgi:hypothetical protein